MKSYRRILESSFLCIVLIATLAPYSSNAGAAPLQKKQKKSKKAKGEPKVTAPAEPTAQPAAEQVVQPAAQPVAQPPVQPVAQPVARPAYQPTTTPTQVAAETARPARSVWGLEVSPHAVLGSGRPGKTAADFDKPDGVAFLKNGWLLATDAKNHRVQIWDVQARTYLGELGHGVFGGEVVDIAVTPDDKVLITDQILNLAYLFEPPVPGARDEKGKLLGPYGFQFKGTRFGEQGFEKLGGIAVDAKGRVYLVDAHRNEVKRFTPDFTLDPSFNFEATRPDGSTYLHGCEGIAFDEAHGNLFIASEKDSVVQVFDLESGAYKKRLIGKSLGADTQPSGAPVFAGAIEGLTITGNHLLAVDESVGQIQIFDLNRPDVFNTDLASFSSRPRRATGYRGFFGHPPLVNFEDKTNVALQQKVKDGSIIPGQANPPGYFCSPDAIASHTDAATGETYIAIADQCNYRIAVYRWSDVSRAINAAGTSRTVASAPVPAAEKAAPAAGGAKKKKGKKQAPGF